MDSTQSAFIKRRLKFRQDSLEQWKLLTEALSDGQPVVSWAARTQMTDILTRIGQQAPLNHVLFPGHGGGLDLIGARRSHEDGCIELNFDGTATIICPVSLRLVMPQNDPLREWAYFVLETRGLAPSGAFSTPTTLDYERVLELEPTRYVDPAVRDDGVYEYDDDGSPLPLPSYARLVDRYLRGGPFLIIAKASSFQSGDTYEGRHAQLSAPEFDRVMQEIVNELHARGLYGKPPWGSSGDTN